MARGIGGSYGEDTGNHPRRGIGSWLSQTLGVGTPAPSSVGTLQHFPGSGEGLVGVQPNTADGFTEAETQLPTSYGMYPEQMTNIINSSQFVPS